MTTTQQAEWVHLHLRDDFVFIRFQVHNRVRDHLVTTALRTMVPAEDLRFDPTTEQWIVRSTSRHTVVRWAQQSFAPAAIELTSAATSPARSDPFTSPWEVLHLRPGAPVEVVNAAYRALARTLHPDSGGDAAAMQRLNAAYDRIRKQLQK